MVPAATLLLKSIRQYTYWKKQKLTNASVFLIHTMRCHKLRDIL